MLLDEAQALGLDRQTLAVQLDVRGLRQQLRQQQAQWQQLGITSVPTMLFNQ